ncbi:MAG: GNAT family N-acetyltransferase [Bacteriovoracaceae bacterium]|nr:GNAT family N-acetyltransferase [Bacteriovoracaceae bacterium]
MKIIYLDNKFLSEAFTYLNQHVEYSMFLLQNLSKIGPRKTGDHNSGDFNIVINEGKIVGIFVLAKRGNLLFSLDKEVIEMDILNYLYETEEIEITGVLGENSRSKFFWHLIKSKNDTLVETFTSNEILYRMNLADSCADVSGAMVYPLDKFSTYTELSKSFYLEQGLEDISSDEQRLKTFEQRVCDGHIWCYKDREEIVSMCSLNAVYKDIAQVGGVFTPKRHRLKGFSKKCMKKLVYDCITKLNLSTIILFTGTENISAQKVYEGIGLKKIGSYGMYFGSTKRQINKRE